MKHLFSTTLLAIVAISYSLAEETGLVYYMPETELEIELTYIETIHQPGVYASYAHSLLGVEASTVADTCIRVKQVDIRTHTRADHSRSYSIPNSAAPMAQRIRLTSKGILEGYNLVSTSIADKKKDNKNNRAKQPNETQHNLALPLNEESIKASESEKPSAIAKQILMLREIRQYTLSGDVEHAPADGKAMKLVLDKLDEQEQQLTALFTGTEQTNRRSIKFILMPCESMDSIMTTMADMPLRLVMEGHRASLDKLGSSSGEKVDKKKAHDVPSPIFYNLPGYVDIRVLLGENLLAAKRVDVAQMGVVLPISQSLINDGSIQIVFNTKTGNIQSIDQK